MISDVSAFNEKLHSNPLQHCTKKGVFCDHIYLWSNDEKQKINLQQIFSDFHPVHHTTDDSLSVVLQNEDGAKKVVILLAQKPEKILSLAEMAFPIAAKRLLESSLDHLPPNAGGIGASAKHLFSKRNEKHILHSCQEDLKGWAQQIWNALLESRDSKEVDVMANRYFDNLPQILEQLYGIGKGHIAGWFCLLIQQHLAKKWGFDFESKRKYPLDCHVTISKVLEEFIAGQPQALLAVADLATNDTTGWGNVSFQKIPPLSDPIKRFAITEKLAYLHVEKAMKAWTDVYYKNKFIKGSDEKEAIRSLLSVQERLVGLKNLALGGCWAAQEKWVEAYYYNSFTRDYATCNLTEKERKDGLKWAEKEEGKSNRFCNLIAQMYRNNGIPDIKLNMTLDERLACLEKRAVKGEECSLTALIDFYLGGWLGEDPCAFSLQERYQQFEELKKIGVSLWNFYYAAWIMKSPVFSVNFQSEEEKFTVLLDFLEKHQMDFSTAKDDIFLDGWFKALSVPEQNGYLLRALRLGSVRALQQLKRRKQLPQNQELIPILIARASEYEFREYLEGLFPKYKNAIALALFFEQWANHIKWQTIHFQQE